MAIKRRLTRGSVKIETTGILFDRARAEGVLNKAIQKGTKELLPDVQDVIQAKLHRSLKEPTGDFQGSIKGKVYKSGTGVVKSHDNRRLKTWIERRTRGGKRLGTGAYAFRAGKTFVKKANKNGYYAPFIAAELKK